MQKRTIKKSTMPNTSLQAGDVVSFSVPNTHKVGKVKPTPTGFELVLRKLAKPTTEGSQVSVTVRP